MVSKAVWYATRCPNLILERLQSATYILSDVGEPAPDSTTLPPAPNAPPTSPDGEQGHSDAIWCAKWARKAGGGEVVATAGADHTIKLW
jgi:WD40 repeat protein